MPKPKKTKPSKLVGLVEYGILRQIYLPRKRVRKGQSKFYLAKNQTVVPLNAKIIYRQPITGKFASRPIEIPVSKQWRAYRVKYKPEQKKNEGRQNWRSESACNFGKRKYSVALFDYHGTMLRYLSKTPQMLTRGLVNYYSCEEYPETPEGVEQTIDCEGETVLDCLKNLHIGMLGWGAIVQLDGWVNYSYIEDNIRHNEKFFVTHLENYNRDKANNELGLPQGETFHSVLIKRFAQKIRARMFEADMRFTELPVLKKRLFSEFYRELFWEWGYPGDAMAKEIYDKWYYGNNRRTLRKQVAEMKIHLTVTRLAFPKVDSHISAKHLRRQRKDIK